MADPNWKKFEKNAAKHLNENIKMPDVIFKSVGESDSGASDVEVFVSEVLKFSIECKFVPAQSSQFVVKEVNGKFVYSDDNKSSEKGSKKIIQHMNDNFDSYAAQSGSVDLTCGPDLMYARVVEQLKVKSIFFAASESVGRFSEINPLVIDCVENLPKYFDISGVYRHKRSGTSYAKANHLGKFKGVIKKGSKFYVHDPKNLLPKYPPEDTSIFLPDADETGHRVFKKRSNTNNKNVIFTLKLKAGIKHTDLDILRKYIKQL